MFAFVVGERDGAVLAFEFLAAGAAEDDRGISAAVEQDHDLLFAVEPLFYFGGEFARDDLLMAGLLELLAHVDDFDFGQRALFYAIGQFDQRIFIFLCVEIRLQRGRGRTQHDDRVRHLGAHYGNIAGVVARRFFLLVGGVVLFVDDDQCEIGDRGKDCGARADDHAGVSTFDAVPLLGAFAVGERGVEDGNFIAEDLMQVGGDGRGQTDFGDEQDRGTSGFEHAAHGCEIHRCLARSGDAVQQHAGEFVGRDAFPHACERGLLRGVQIEIEKRRTGLGARDGELRGLLQNLDEAPTNQRSERGSRDVERMERGHRNFSAGRGERVDKFPLIVIEFAFDGFQLGDFYRAAGVLRSGHIFARQPFLANHSGENGSGDFRGGAERFFADQCRALRGYSPA